MKLTNFIPLAVLFCVLGNVSIINSADPGVRRTKDILSKKERGETHTSHYHYGIQGRRPEMEDAHKENVNHEDFVDGDFFGVFDGHGGKEASQFAAQKVPQYFRKHKKENSLFESLHHAYEKASTRYIGTGASDGTTAVVAYIDKSREKPVLYVANAGDSRAVIAMRNPKKKRYASEAHALTRDHKPSEPRERERLEKEHKSFLKVKRNSIGRVASIRLYSDDRSSHLAVSRSIGDAPYIQSGLMATPDVLARDLFPKHQFLILACDGVWDFIDNQGAVNVVIDALRKYPGSPSYAAAQLVKTAYVFGSTDNISATVIPLWPYVGLSAQESLGAWPE